MHQPEQRLTDYKAQKATREAPIIALLSTVMVGVLSSVVASTLAVRGFIGQYVPNFFPDYFPWHLGTMPLYTPWAMWKAYDQFYQYPMLHPFFCHGWGHGGHYPGHWGASALAIGKGGSTA